MPLPLFHQKPPLVLILSLFLLAFHLAFAFKFPSNFAWGASTSSYQIEGAWNVSGKGLDWNSWLALYDKTPLNETAFIADDFYHRFQEDVNLMKKVGLKSFRLSLAWTRIGLCESRRHRFLQ